MCERLSSGCPPSILMKAACHVKWQCGESTYVTPIWLDSEDHTFTPSVNISPGDVCPVLMSGEHFGLEPFTRVLKPMEWGLIPSLDQGQKPGSSHRIYNNRVEGVRQMYSIERCFRKSYRCAVVCDGFYGWKTRYSGVKQPYYVYNRQEDAACRVDDIYTWECGRYDRNVGWDGPKLLYAAALYDLWTDHQGKMTWTFSILTKEADRSLSWLHPRMPVILVNDCAVTDWIRVSKGPVPFHLLKWLTNLESKIDFHPVGLGMNNPKNKNIRCNKPIPYRCESFFV